MTSGPVSSCPRAIAPPLDHRAVESRVRHSYGGETCDARSYEGGADGPLPVVRPYARGSIRTADARRADAGPHAQGRRARGGDEVGRCPRLRGSSRRPREGDGRFGRRRRGDHDRRAFRRGEGASRRLLHRQRGRHRRGAVVGAEDVGVHRKADRGSSVLRDDRLASRHRVTSATDQILARARAGDGDAFRELTDPYRRELQVHVYRIVGSAQDAEDLLQDTLFSAWRGLEPFQGRASLRAWLYRIATNRSLDALRASRRRPEDRRMTQMPEPTRWSEPVWLEPYPGVLLE